MEYFFLHGRFFQVPIKVNLDKINLVGEVKLSLQLNLVIRHCEVNKASKFWVSCVKTSKHVSNKKRLMFDAMQC